MGAAFLLGIAAPSAIAADTGAAVGKRGVSQHFTTPRTRVFSKDKPLFGQSQKIPNLTPDRSGSTKVKVIVKPNEPDRRTTVADDVKEPVAQRSARPSPQLKANRGNQNRPQSADVSTSSSQKNSSKVVRAASNSEDRERGLVSSSVLLPTGNPKRVSVPRSAHHEQSQVKRASKVKTKPSMRAGSVTRKRQEKPRKRYTGRSSNRPYRSKRQHRRPYWRRFAPPGTVQSFVRCWPGEPCVRYYRVRRPKTLRQYRKLLAWQRRQDARLRYRRRYGHY